jgi:hypothetical protein
MISAMMRPTESVGRHGEHGVCRPTAASKERRIASKVKRAETKRARRDRGDG